MIQDESSADAHGTDRFRALLEQSGELARLLLKSPQAPRALTSEFLHARKRFSSEDKGRISSLAHHALRCWRPSCAALTGDAGDVDHRIDRDMAEAVTATALLLALEQRPGFPLPFELRVSPWTKDEMSSTAQTIIAHYSSGKVVSVDTLSATLDAVTVPAVHAALQDWTYDTLTTEGMAAQEIHDLGQTLCEAPPLTLRVNLMRNSREELLQLLAEQNVPALPHSLLPAAIVVQERLPLTESELYREGRFEVQDAGSQLIGHACAVSEGDTVYDACAGGGGKSIHLCDQLGGSGRLLASDIERNKLRGLRQRAKRLALTNIELLAVTPFGDPQNPDEHKPDPGSFDCVLVDAPCSGFGTVRRNPALKWRLQERTVHRLASRQSGILSRNAVYVRSGGILLYATCSLLPEENAHIVRAFLSTHSDFSLENISPAFRKQNVDLPLFPEDHGMLTLPPSVLDSDGFFMARMRRS